MLPSKTDFYAFSQQNPTFAAHIAAFYTEFVQRSEQTILLYTENARDFLVIVFASLLAQKRLELLHSGKYFAARELLENGSLYVSDNEHSAISLTKIFENAHHVSSECLKGLTIHNDSVIGFYTSGSMGTPKLCKKKLYHIEHELQQLINDYSDTINNAVVLSTVPHYHFYGFLFYVLLPFALNQGIPQERIQYQEALASFSAYKKITLISSPAFLKRLAVNEAVPQAQWTVFSSGGLLENDAAENCLAVFKTEAIEIYGSTETGGIARRQQKTNPLWKPFSCVKVRADKERVLLVTSPYFDEQEIRAGDFAEFSEAGLFSLLGRTDSTVKVEGKRIDLQDVDSRLRKHTAVADSYTLLYASKNREQLASFVVLKPDSELAVLNQQDSIQAKKILTNYVRPYFDTTVLPKKIMFLTKIPRNQMSKIDRTTLLQLLEKKQPFYTYEVSEKTDYEAKIAIVFPAWSPFFDGHFPNFLIVPGVAQVKTAFDLSKTLFQHDFYIQSAKKIKFTGFIQPDSVFSLTLRINKAEKTLDFVFFTAEKKFSYGTLFMEREHEC